ncbi:hypothetical protein [Psychrobacillus sp. NPDC093180]|uniref:hypothetical protein n=1 Tax=Psychrobacillus sp. NPDC093180 TaxID=3364489 RepID=UPI00380F931A
MRKKRKSKMKDNILTEEELFGEFAFIAGYTEGGAPYGILKEYWDELGYIEEEVDLKDETLPF